MKKIGKVIYNIIRFIVRSVLWTLLVLFRMILKYLTIEPGKNKEITPRKARRIRFLSKVKYRFLNTLPDSANKFIGTENYKNYLNKHLENGLQLRNYTTNKRAV